MLICLFKKFILLQLSRAIAVITAIKQYENVSVNGLGQKASAQILNTCLLPSIKLPVL